MPTPYNSTHTGAQVDAAVNQTATNTTDIAALQAGKSNVGHTHSAADIVSGIMAVAQLGTGTANASTVLSGDQTYKQISDAQIAIGAAIDALKIGSGLVSNTEFGYLDGVTSAIQTQLNAKSAVGHTHPATDIGGGTVSDTEFGYLDGVTSAIQTQLNGKAASSHTHAAADIVSGTIGTARLGSGTADSTTFLSGDQTYKQVANAQIAAGVDAVKIGGGAVSNTEFGYLDGVTAAIQTQLDGKAASSHTHAAADIVSGTILAARLGSGTANSTTVLSGDQTYKQIADAQVAAAANIAATKIGTGVVDNTEFNYLDGVTSAIQTQLGARFQTANDLSEINTATKRTNARGNLGVLWSDDTIGMMQRRLTKGGIITDVQIAWRLTGTTAGPAIGLKDFSIAAIVQFSNYATGNAQGLFASHNTGNNRVELWVSTTGTIQIKFIDNAGATTTYSMTPDVALVGGATYMITVTCARSGNATLYINELTDRDVSGAGVTVSISGSSGVDIGSGNANGWGIGNTTLGVLFDVWLFNQLLPASAVQSIARNGGPLVSQQSASLTPIYTSDFSAGADGWVTHTDVVPTGNVDAISDGTTSKDDVLQLATGTGTSIHIARRFTTFTPLRNSRVTGSYYIPSGLAFNAIRVGWNTNGAPSSGGFTADLTVVGVWTDFSIELNGNTGDPIFVSLMNGTNVTFNGVAGQSAYLKNLVVTKIGAIFDPEISEADPAISTALRDRAPGAYHGTISSVCSQVKPCQQINTSRLAVTGPAVLLKLLTNTAALDFGSIAAGASADLTITVTGVAVGDSVALGPPSAPTAGIIFWAFVSATNVVTVRATNITAGAIDPASQTFRATVFQF